MAGTVTGNDSVHGAQVPLPFLTSKTVKAEEQIITFSKVPLGYYFVASSLGAVVTVDGADASAEIIDKNQGGPGWGTEGGKFILDENGDRILADASGDIKNSANSANYGDKIEYEIQFGTTNYDGEKAIISYEVKDKLADGLKYVMNDAGTEPVVTVSLKDGTPLENSAYTVSYDSSANSFTVEIPWAETTEVDSKKVVSSMKYDSPNTITIRYAATAGKDVVIAGNGNENAANFTYTTLDDDGKEEKEPYSTANEEKTTTYVYALGILKTNNEAVKLTGAEETYLRSFCKAPDEREEGKGRWAAEKKDATGSVQTRRKKGRSRKRSDEKEERTQQEAFRQEGRKDAAGSVQTRRKKGRSRKRSDKKEERTQQEAFRQEGRNNTA